VYLLDFVNLVRAAQGVGPVDELPLTGDEYSSPLELAMGCRLEPGGMRLSSPRAADAVSRASGLPFGEDEQTIALPNALSAHASVLHAARELDRSYLERAEAV
jgi:hypothetical protein